MDGTNSATTTIREIERKKKNDNQTAISALVTFSRWPHSKRRRTKRTQRRNIAVGPSHFHFIRRKFSTENKRRKTMAFKFYVTLNFQYPPSAIVEQQQQEVGTGTGHGIRASEMHGIIFRWHDSVRNFTLCNPDSQLSMRMRTKIRIRISLALSRSRSHSLSSSDFIRFDVDIRLHLKCATKLSICYCQSVRFTASSH